MTFDHFLRSLGLRPRTILPDGRIRRCATEDKPRGFNGAYKLMTDGRVGWGQDWGSMPKPAIWRARGRYDGPEPVDVAALRRAEQEQVEARRRAQDAARLFYSGCSELRGGHPYLAAKGLDMQGCHGLRVDGEGWLVIPALRNGIFQSIQRIAPDGTKRFWRGAPVKGSSYVIDRRDAQVTVYCEGLATGLACYRAVPASRVVVAWDAGNLAQLTDRSCGLTVVAADNDHGTAERLGKNPGLEAAQQAAQALGCGLAFPEGIKGTDFADYRVEHISQRLARRYRETTSRIERAVDAEIADRLMRAARFVPRA
jgi:putative DNA primase/helicase